jgi:hypothetical protein
MEQYLPSFENESRMTKQSLQLAKPVIQRSYVTITEAITKECRHVTVYGATPDQVIAKLDEPEPKKREVRQEGNTPARSSAVA